MGGSISVVIVKPNGEIFKTLAWTNPLPNFINTIHFINKDLEHIERYTKRIVRARKDIQNPELRKKYDSDRIEELTQELLAPEGYGLVVFDLKNNLILSCQGYTSFGDISATLIELTLGGSVLTDDGLDAVTRIKEIIEAKKIKDIDMLPEMEKSLKSKYNISKKDLINITFPKLTKLLQDARNDRFCLWFDFILNMSPFKIINYEEDKKGCKKMYKKVKSLYHLSDEEKTMWNNWIKEM